MTAELLRRQRSWLYDRDARAWTIPKADVELLWNDRADWRAYSRSLEAAGDWRAP